MRRITITIAALILLLLPSTFSRSYEDMIEQSYIKCEKELQSCQENQAMKTSFDDYAKIVKEYSEYTKTKYNIVVSNDKEIIEIAKQLKKDNVEDTIDATWLWANNNINFKYYSDKRDFKTIINSQLGDCTDIVTIMNILLEQNGIISKAVYGNCREKCKNSVSYKHDWIEVLYPTDGWAYWKPFNRGDEKLGNGYW